MIPRSPESRPSGSLSPSRRPSIDCRARRLAASDAVVVVEDDDRLAALLEQHAAACGVGSIRPAVLSQFGAAARERAASAGRVHHPVTIPSPFVAPVDDGATPHSRRMAKILIIEDDDVIAQGMARHLQAAGFDAVGVANGETGLARLRYERPDVCVLDLMLPGLDGWKVIEQARGEGIGTPIVVVRARGTEHDRVHALEIGADDYLVKPFSMKELVARVGAAARRGTRAQDPRRGEEIVIEELRLDPRNVQAYVDGESAELTPTEFRLALRARARDRPRADARRAPPARLGPPRVPPRPDGGRLRPQAPREDRQPRLAAHVPPDALRRRLQARSRARSSATRGLARARCLSTVEARETSNGRSDPDTSRLGQARLAGPSPPGSTVHIVSLTNDS